MIYVKLMGGLGNQMFQYAFGRMISFDLNEKLFLDTSFLDDKSLRENFTVRDYELDVFKLTARVGSINKFHSLLHRPYKTVKEKGLEYQIEKMGKYKNSLYVGYFQSEKYFLPIRNILLDDFTFRNISPENIELASAIKSLNSVSIHVRRGDYISSPKVLKTHGTCSLNYYQKAIESFEKNGDDYTFFIFSDDIDWARKNIVSSFSLVFVDQNKGKKSYQDLFLMSLCKHNIIANSSFSWWGAWLNKNDSKKVIAPRPWYADNSLNTRDLIPSSWLQVSN